MTIGMETITYMGDQVKALLFDYQRELDKAYLERGDEPLSIGITIKATPAQGGTKSDVAINFITGRIKDKTSGIVNEVQMNMFSEPKGQTYRPSPRVGRAPRFKPLGG